MNKLIKNKVLFYYNAPYYFHAQLAKSLDADFLKAPRAKSNFSRALKLIYFALKLPKKYPVYFCEDTYAIPALAKKIGLIQGKIITLTAASLWYYFNKENNMNKVVKWCYINLLKEVDIFIAPSEMSKKFIDRIKPNAKVLVIPTCPSQQSKNHLLKIHNIIPNLNSHNILLIANGPDSNHKGLDLLVKAFVKIKKKWPDAELNIAGKWDKNQINNYTAYNNSIHFLGYVEDIYKLIKSSALYVHLGRGDAFPASSIEAMLGGLPSIVSIYTGTKEIVEQVDKKFVVSLNTTKVEKLINYYFLLSPKRKLELSKKFFLAAANKKYDEKYNLKKFKITLQKMLTN